MEVLLSKLSYPQIIIIIIIILLFITFFFKYILFEIIKIISKLKIGKFEMFGNNKSQYAIKRFKDAIIERCNIVFKEEIEECMGYVEEFGKIVIEKLLGEQHRNLSDMAFKGIIQEKNPKHIRYYMQYELNVRVYINASVKPALKKLYKDSNLWDKDEVDFKEWAEKNWWEFINGFDDYFRNNYLFQQEYPIYMGLPPDKDIEIKRWVLNQGVDLFFKLRHISIKYHSKLKELEKEEERILKIYFNIDK